MVTLRALATGNIGRLIAGTASAALLALSSPVAAQNLIRSQLLVGGLSQPVDLEAPPGDNARVFIVEQTGKIRIFNFTTGLQAAAFIDLGPAGLNLVTSGSEKGLLGIAFDPDYATNGYFYLNYTGAAGATFIARYTAQAPFATSTSANTGTAVVLKTIAQPFTNHNGGQLQFGPDGMLYIAMGDGGSANDPNEYAQNYASLLGKVLRLDVDNPGNGYIPADNPYIEPSEPQADEIWAAGVRNPWRFSFDRLTGDLWIADVGQDAREEVNFQPALTLQNYSLVAGRNYGWDCREGKIAATGTDMGCDPNATGVYTDPVIDYVNGSGTQGNCSVSGGVVYRGAAIPALQGAYLYADYCSDFIRSLRYNGTTVSDQREWAGQLSTTAGPIGNIVGFGEDASGEVYVISVNGSIYKIISDSANCGCPCVLTTPQVTLFTDHFQTNLGWTVTSGGATAGAWARGTPVNDNNYASDPVTDSDGSGMAYLTQNATGTATDVDGGSTILTSPAIDGSRGKVSVCYDYFLDLVSPTAGLDGLFVDISSNGTAGPWTRIGTHTTDNGLRWIAVSVTSQQLTSLGVAFTSDMRLRFTATDAPNDSTVEAGVDNVAVYGACHADYNGDGFADGIDSDLFNNDFEAGNPAADINGDGFVDGIDYDLFMNDFENGC